MSLWRFSVFGGLLYGGLSGVVGYVSAAFLVLAVLVFLADRLDDL